MAHIPFENGWLGDIEKKINVKFHIFTSWHMTFKAHFHKTWAFYHYQFPLKNRLPWKCFNGILSLLWPSWNKCQGQISLFHFMTYQSSYSNAGAHYHGQDLFSKWVTLKMLFNVKLHFILSWHVTLDSTGQWFFRTWLYILVTNCLTPPPRIVQPHPKQCAPPPTPSPQVIFSEESIRYWFFDIRKQLRFFVQISSTMQ